MRYIINPSKGMTLIEAIIYIALLSILMSGFIASAWSVHEQNMRLLDRIQDAYAK